jgi:hypothetical protein
MTNTLILAHQYSLPFTLEAGGCDYGIGAVLIQQGKPNLLHEQVNWTKIYRHLYL